MGSHNGTPPFFLVLWAASLNVASCLISLPYGAWALNRPTQLLSCCLKRFCRACRSISSLCVCMLARREYMCLFLKPIRIISWFSSLLLLLNVTLKEKIHKYISFFSKLVCRLSRLHGCNQYLLSGQQWHIIYLQETIPVFMYELNMPRRHQRRLHICNWSARKDWHTAVNSIQTWLGQIEEWMLLLFELKGEGRQREVLTGYQCSLSRPQSLKSMFSYKKASGKWVRLCN